MKTLKITLALVAVLVLTVSGVQSENVVVDNQPTSKEVKAYDLLVHAKKKLKKESNG
ncbi:hypothetical protein [Winogradskyella sp. R77965]|uniref:hypothetical protein n=1 Tax=Winogradskyella sp. R77965 TaxID=3093872 RepID=UPI0037DD74B0